MNRIILNETSYFGAGCRSVIAVEAARRGFKKAFFVTDKDLIKFGVAAEIIKVFDDKFRGNPYVWGGESLTNGVDCSGFTMQVYKHFGYSLPHSSTAQRYEGTAVSWNEKQPGDLICYQVVNGVGHVAIYIGDNQIIHAGSKDTGINVRNADYRAVWGVRRIVQ